MNFKKILFSLFFVFIFLNLISLPIKANAANNITATLNLVSGGSSDMGSSAPTSSGSVSGNFWYGNFASSGGNNWSLSGALSFSTMKAVKFHFGYPSSIWNGCVCRVDPNTCGTYCGVNSFGVCTGCTDSACCNYTCDISKCLKTIDSDYYYFCQNATATLSGGMTLTGCGNTVANVPVTVTYQAYDVGSLCGSANGASTLSAPTSGLCKYGTASGVTTNTSNFTWTCSACGGSTSCSAPKTVINGACGSTNGGSYSSKPTSGLCNAGSASAVSGTNSWSWTCSGTNDGATASCSATRPISAACGSSNGGTYTEKPTTGLCNPGTASAVSGYGPWSWTCYGTSGGASASCSAYVRVIAGKCGSADGKNLTSAPTAKSSLCSSGTASGLTFYTSTMWNYPGYWSWMCSGSGGSTVTSSICSANQLVGGTCGFSAGLNFYTAPTTGLCSTGTASAVSGVSSWYWTCSGANGSFASSCWAGISIDGICGFVNGGYSATKPTWGLCSYTASFTTPVSGSNPWYWTCYGSGAGSTVSCNTLPPTNGVCGPANGVASSNAPMAGLCIPDAFVLVNSNSFTGWSWTCPGVGGTSASCSAPNLMLNAACGSASGVASLSAPTTNLCSTGTASTVSTDLLNNNWSWTCNSSFGYISSASCSAPKTSTTNGICGFANGVATSNAPTTNLCLSGVVSAISGSGPWSWTCNGSNGGSNDSCSAPVITALPTNGVCGLTNGVATSTAPTIGRCYSGTSGTVSVRFGDNYWVWTCSGINGGTSASCSAPNLMLNAACGSANGVATSTAPTTGLCNPDAPALVGLGLLGNWSWTCSGSVFGTTASCSAPKTTPSTNGVCGPANGGSFYSFPTSGLCSVGLFSSPLGPYVGFVWNCVGSGTGRTDASCGASQKVDGVCGSANGVAVSTPPTRNFCLAGYASSIPSGLGPWSWTCVGLNGGTTSSLCSAPTSIIVVNGACGSDNGKYLSSSPTSLCNSGTASTISGSGPWTWTCAGSGGGATPTCVAGLIPSSLTSSENDCPNSTSTTAVAKVDRANMSELKTKMSQIYFSWSPASTNYTYELELSESNKPTDPYDYIDSSPIAGTSRIINVVEDPNPGQPQISFGKKYYWWLKVFDSSNNIVSSWIPAPTTFTTVPHFYPTPKIVYTPISPLIRNPVSFDATSSISFDTPTFLWTFIGGNTSTFPRLTKTYNSVGTYAEKLAVCDKENNCCSISTDVKVINALSLPQWREVSPF